MAEAEAAGSPPKAEARKLASAQQEEAQAAAPQTAAEEVAEAGAEEVEVAEEAGL